MNANKTLILDVPSLEIQRFHCNIEKKKKGLFFNLKTLNSQEIAYDSHNFVELKIVGTA